MYNEDCIDTEANGNLIQPNDIEEVINTRTIHKKNRNINSSKISLDFTKTDISKNKLQLKGYIIESSTNKKVKFDLDGTLYLGSEQKVGLDTYVATLTDRSKNFDVLYFYIKNDTQKTKYIFDDNLNDKKMFAMYLQDDAGNVYIFED